MNAPVAQTAEQRPRKASVAGSMPAGGPIDTALILELASRFQQYPGSKEVTLRGNGIVEFARALLALAERETAAAEERAAA
jgi:hypothetical protein